MEDIIVKVILVRHLGTYSWVIPVCPNCAETHWHGGGYIKTELDHKADDPRDYLSRRCVHCAKDFGDYILVEDERFKKEKGYTITEARSLISRIRKAFKQGKE